MAISLWATGVSSVENSTLTYAHNVSIQDNRFLLVGLSIRTVTSTGLTITYAGSNLSRLVTGNDAGSTARTELWYLNNPATGTNNVVVTLSATSRFVAGSNDFYGVDTSTSPSTGITATAASATPKLSITKTYDDSWIVGAISHRNSTAAYNVVSGNVSWSGVTPGTPASSNEHGRGLWSTAGTAGQSVLISGTISVAREWVQAEAEIYAYNPVSYNQGYVIKAFN